MAAKRRLALTLLLLAMIGTLAQTSCTRDDVAGAVSTLAAGMQATLEPWGATAEASAFALATSVPAALATAAQSNSADALDTPRPLTTAIGIENLPTVAPTTGFELLGVKPPATVQPTPTLVPTATATPAPPPTATATATPAPSPTPLAPVIQVDGGTMVLVPGGFFEMGAAADDLLAECARFATNCRRQMFVPSEPVHSVLVAPYYMDSHEVTNETFARFLNARGGSVALCFDQPCLDAEQSQMYPENGLMAVAAPQATYPATGVTWYGAAAFCEWRGARLPSEAEWEKAAAWDDAGAVARRYPWGNEFDGKRLNFCDANCDAPQANLAWNDAFARAAPVAYYEAGRSAAGLYDMAGNVWEWVADWFDPAYYAVSPGADPTGPETGEEKVVRGASWYDTAYVAAAAVRFPSSPGNADRTLGFRCAADTP